MITQGNPGYSQIIAIGDSGTEHFHANPTVHLCRSLNFLNNGTGGVVRSTELGTSLFEIALSLFALERTFIFRAMALLEAKSEAL